ncbi:cytochrome c oxidase subunit II [Altericroceibacterium xinjiangense]|uniref:cytochrome c oxidase subunit II n=1 Tax=Altericroceibacterium xinjiangense TaxID=762261 RepID=UPI000F7F2689|nr:cytochrome c oxidase subunit II [Altericroceibacterium xinjiangense]
MIDALWGWPPPVLDPAGPYSERVTILAWVLLAMALVVTLIVVIALWIAVKGPDSLKRKLGGEKTVWIGGIAFPGVVLSVLLVWGLMMTGSLSEPITGKEMRIRVVGEMWWFRVQYLDNQGRVVMDGANEIHIPTNVPVVLELTSADVIHSFWVPHLSGKKDMIPGRVTLLRIEADRPGVFGGVCAEYCGGPHALMGFVTVAHEPEEWKQWAVQRNIALGEAIEPFGSVDVAGALPVVDDDVPPRIPPTPIVGEAARGRALFMSVGCAACHRVAGTEANGLAGPDLTHVGSRRTLGAGILPNHLGTMMGWIGDSQAIKPGIRMPSYDRLPAEDIAAMAMWLEQQK